MTLDFVDAVVEDVFAVVDDDDAVLFPSVTRFDRFCFDFLRGIVAMNDFLFSAVVDDFLGFLLGLLSLFPDRRLEGFPSLLLLLEDEEDLSLLVAMMMNDRFLKM